jgi:glycosyltransferase involved in cell wall biosynthesis
MKILYISSEDMRKEGAGKTHFIEVAQNLVKLGNELLILLPGYQPYDRKNYGLNVCYVPTFRKNTLSYLLYEIVSFFYLTFYILNWKPDVIYLRQGLFEVFPPILARLFGVPYVIEKNGLMEDEFRSRGFSEIVIKILRLAEEINFRLSDKIVCVTEGIKREIVRRYKVNEGKLMVIPNGANIELFRPLDKRECRRKLGLEENAFYVGFVGSFAPWQGLEILIEAAKRVKEQGYAQIKYILVGDGEQESLLRQKVREYKLEQEIRFTGRVAYEQVVNYINTFDVCYLCKERLSFGFSPLKLYEYLACGRPVIASRVDGVKEVIEEGKCGYLFEPGDAEELAKRIIQSYQERDALQEMGLRGRRLVENKYSWRMTAKRIVKVLNEIIEKN